MSATGNARLERGAPDTHKPRFRQLLSSVSTENARPRTLRIEARVALNELSDEQQRQLVYQLGGAGVWWARGENSPLPWDGGAALSIVYGSTPGIRRQIFADLRPGEYVIPPCESIMVSAAYWCPDFELGELGDAPLEVFAAVADGDASDSSPLILSAVRTTTLSGARCPVPPGAYAWDAYALDTPIRAQCGSVQAMRVQGGAWTPPTHPIPIAGPYSDAVDVVRIGEGLEGAWTPMVLFYVR